MKRPFMLMLILLIGNIFFMLNFSYIVLIGVVLLITTLLVFYYDYKIIFIVVLSLSLSFFIVHAIHAEVPGYEDEIIIAGDISEYGINHEDSFVLNTNYMIRDSIKKKFKHKVLIKYQGEYSHLIGKSVIIKTKLNLPFQNTNPNLFNYRNYLRAQGIDYSGSLNPQNILKISEDYHLLSKGIHSFRALLSQHLEKVYSGKTLAFIKGFIYGDKSEFTEKQLSGFYNVGLGHILVVSGLHFGMLFLILQWLLKKSKINQIHQLIIIHVTLLLFLAITGFKVSSLRAFLMIILLESVYLIDRRLDLLNFLSFLCLVIILFNPMSIYSVSFMLSFGAIFSIGFFYKGINRVLPSFISIVLSVQVIIGLISIHVFNQINFSTLLINIPINFFIVVLYALILLNLILFPFKILTFMITQMITLIFKSVEFFNGKDFLRVILPSFSNHQLILIFSLLFVLVLIYEGKNIKKRTLFHLLLLGYIIILGTAVLGKSIEIHFYDVKSGDAIFMTTPRKNKVLIDTGRNDSYNLIGDILLKNGIKDIDLLFLSHSHDDHTGGLENLLESHHIKYLFISRNSDFIYDINKYDELLGDTEIILLTSGNEVTYDNMVFKVLTTTDKELNENNQSLVLDIEYQAYKMLFTGDIEKEVEFELTDQLRENYDLLKVPHHGSETSSTKRFLEKVKPMYSIVQVGRNNYGHPEKNVLKRYEDVKTTLLRNDLNGCVIFKLGKDIEYKTLITE